MPDARPPEDTLRPEDVVRDGLRHYRSQKCYTDTEPYGGDPDCYECRAWNALAVLLAERDAAVQALGRISAFGRTPLRRQATLTEIVSIADEARAAVRVEGAPEDAENTA